MIKPINAKRMDTQNDLSNTDPVFRKTRVLVGACNKKLTTPSNMAQKACNYKKCVIVYAG